MGVRRPTRQSPSGLRTGARTGREITHVSVGRGRSQRGEWKQLPVFETGIERPKQTPAKPKPLEL